MKNLFIELCRESSLHGVQYLVKAKSVVEKVLWSVLLSLVTVIMVWVVYTMWNRIFNGPVLVLVQDSHYDLSMVDFPAVTICPNNKAMREKVQKVLKENPEYEKNYSAFENSIIAMSLMRYPYYNLPQDYVELVDRNVFPILEEDLPELMIRVGADIDDIVTHCKWRSISYPCKQLFRRQITQEGFCYSFNSKTAERLYDEPKGMPPLKMANGEIAPLRTNMFGRNSGLGFRLKSLAQKTLKSDIIGDAYSCSIHNPNSDPTFHSVLTIPPDNPSKLYQITASASVIEADDSLLNLDESERACKIVDSKNILRQCWMNCRDETILKFCQCLPYYRIMVRPDVPVCGFLDLPCLREINSRVRYPNNSNHIPGFPSWSKFPTMECGCLPSCADVAYVADIEEYPVVLSRNVSGWTRVRVIYKTYAVKYSRTAKYVYRDFLVGCSSVASLLLGFSTVAAFDGVVYFFKFFYRLIFPYKKSIGHRIRKVKINMSKSDKHKSKILTMGKRIAFKSILKKTSHNWAKVLPTTESDGPICPFVN